MSDRDDRERHCTPAVLIVRGPAGSLPSDQHAVGAFQLTVSDPSDSVTCMSNTEIPAPRTITYAEITPGAIISNIAGEPTWIVTEVGRASVADISVTTEPLPGRTNLHGEALDPHPEPCIGTPRTFTRGWLVGSAAWTVVVRDLAAAGLLHEGPAA